MERTAVGIWSPPNALAIALVEKFLANFCSVSVFSDEEKDWKLKTSHIHETPYFIIKKGGEQFIDIRYALLLDTSGESNIDSRLQETFGITKAGGIKTLLILSYRELMKSPRNLSLPENVGVVYVGDLFGPRMDLAGEGAPSKVVSNALAKKQIEVSSEEFIFPVPIADAANLIVRWLFSFGPYGEEIAILSKEISTLDFYNVLSRVVSDTNFVLKERRNKDFQKEVPRYVLSFNLAAKLRETFEWFIKFSPKPSSDVPPSPKKPEVRKPNLSVRRFFPIWPAVACALVILFSPYLILTISVLSTGAAYLSVKADQFGIAKGSLVLLSASSEVSHRESLVFSSIPVFGKIYGSALFFSEIFSRSAAIGEEASNLFENSKTLSSKIFGEDTYNPAVYTEKIRLSLDKIYQEVSFLQGDMEAGSYSEKRLVYRIVTPAGLTNAKNLVSASEELASRLPEILGISGKRTYLVLFQNNMELRPTGGFIGSFALATFESGRLTDLSVSDVYSADGQLKGHVEPPAPIKKYLGEGGWYLRDSNWDPDFPTSAGKIEWFLDKEIDQSVDGVISADLETAKLLLKETGPLTIPDFGTTVDSTNVYEKTQTEAQEGFFPGSYNKSSFLTALAKGVLDRVSHPEEKDYVGIAKAAFLSLEGRHVQVFLHDSLSQRGIENLGWDGEVSTPVCSGNCYPDWFGIVEANVGVNKANYFIKREASFRVSLEEGEIKRQLNLTLKNEANAALGEAASYKVYVRLMTLPTSEVGDVSVSGGAEGNLSVSPDINQVSGRKEAGVYLEIQPRESKELVFTWTDINKLNFTKNGEYLLFWRKQAGTGNDNVSATFYLPAGVSANPEPTPSLTSGGNFGYNTTLAKDFMAKIDW